MTRAELATYIPVYKQLKSHFLFSVNYTEYA